MDNQMDCIESSALAKKVRPGTLSPIIHEKTHYWHLTGVHELLLWSKHKLNLVLTPSAFFFLINILAQTVFSSCAYLG